MRHWPVLIASLWSLFPLRRHAEADDSSQESSGKVPNSRPTSYFDPMCNDGRIKEEQRKACRDYGSDSDCCVAFRQGGSCVLDKDDATGFTQSLNPRRPPNFCAPRSQPNG